MRVYVFTAAFVFLCFISTSWGKEIALSESERQEKIKKHPARVAFWNFKMSEGKDEAAFGKANLFLQYSSQKLGRSPDGPFGGSAVFDGKSAYMYIPSNKVGALNLTKEVTVLAWINWNGKSCSFIAGLWNEHTDGGKRQYGLFASLPMYNGADEVCGHISKSGGPTPPFPFSIDYSASGQKIPKNKWVCAAMTYDGKYIKSYLDGAFAARKPELIANTKGFPGYPDGAFHSKNPYFYPQGMGDNGSDFTVGAVMLKNGMGNFFGGKIAAVAIFDKALSDAEISEIARIPNAP